MRKNGFVFIIVLIFSFCAEAFSQVSLSKIDDLIKDTKYDDALTLLNEYIAERPEDFDSAQKRIKKILGARKQYADLANRLIELIQTDPGNDREIYEITSRLEQFEKSPSDQNLQFIADLKKSAEFNYFRAVFTEILLESAELTHQKNYSASSEKLREGFWLYRDSFFEKWADYAEITKAARDYTSQLENLMLSYEDKSFSSKITDSVFGFLKNGENLSYDVLHARLLDAEEQLKKLAKMRFDVYSNSDDFEKLFEKVSSIDSDTTDASYIPFMLHFILGLDSIEDSGLVGNIDYFWNESVKEINDFSFARLEKSYNDFLKDSSSENLETLKNFISLENEIVNLYAYLYDSIVFEDLKNNFEDYMTSSLYVQELSEKYYSLIHKMNFLSETESYFESVFKNYEDMESVSLETVRNILEKNAQSQILLGAKENEKLSKPFIPDEIFKWQEMDERYVNLLDESFSFAEELTEKAWNFSENFYKTHSDDFIASIKSKNEIAAKLTDGIKRKLTEEELSKISENVLYVCNLDFENSFDSENIFEDAGFEISYSYPDIALALCEKIREEFLLAVNALDGFSDSSKTEYELCPSWENDIFVTDKENKIQNYILNEKEKLYSENQRTVQQSSLAQKKISGAVLAKNEADLRFSEAEEALKREDFDTARRKLENALSKYDESLSNQNDENLRSQWDSKLLDLGNRITKSENLIVVREVRELKTLAKDAYFNGRFEDAEKYLNQAKIRWAVTNVDDDEEITNLLNFVNTAISMKTGRDILPSAPQYMEMSQLIDIAYSYFNEGNELLKKGDNSAAREKFSTALENIQKVQFVYPLNQQASILTLRINRLLNPQKFNEEFSQKIQTAREMVKNPETRQEGYSNLLDYYEIEPSYKGLKDLIYQVEIDIGIRQKPADNSAQNNARTYISRARSILNANPNDNARLNEALRLVNQALSVLPDDKNATALKDEITLRIGGNTSTVLSTEDEKLYQLAIQRLQGNNIVGASIIVEQLLKKPQNANSQKIKELKNKIDARS